MPPLRNWPRRLTASTNSSETEAAIQGEAREWPFPGSPFPGPVEFLCFSGYLTINPRRTDLAKNRKARRALKKKPRFVGWMSTDELEIERRKIRAQQETFSFQPLEPEQPFFGALQVQSGEGGRSYRVEVCSLSGLENSCQCPDYRVNGLGTCKHIEAVLAQLRKGRAKLFDRQARLGSPRVEIFLHRQGKERVRVRLPVQPSGAAQWLLSRFFAGDGELLGDPVQAIPALKQALEQASPQLSSEVRLAQDLEEWLEDLRRRRQRDEARQCFLDEVAQGRRSLDVVRLPLYPYQQEGMLHLAFSERALLADEMGLGKTVQAIAACQVLRELRGIERVLVVCPVSLKAEWEEQIARFSGASTQMIYGPRHRRLKKYDHPSFFNLCNYEQIWFDLEDVNRRLSPDVVILDEAQRIKNWHTKTARTIKQLQSRYAFVLTGTPLENRIDDIYSLMDFLDPTVLGPLFRFNREFYSLDEKGHPQEYRNLGELHRRIQPYMLRRRKEEVEDQLPERTVNNFFVEMEQEQAARYDDYRMRVVRLLAITERRPLTKEEFEELQKWLACMRMLCDSPYILDQECRISPKLHELADILEETLEEPENQVLIFSEWERMLQLVRDLAGELEVEYAWHTGSVPQLKRREEIRRFKEDPNCRLFLSTDSGSVGLNLQNANYVINIDLPWNPARLEQRIARAWRKHQTRPVSVINLITEGSIEHRMLYLLDQKQKVADAVLDLKGDLDAVKLPSGRAAFVERLESLLSVPEEKLKPELAAVGEEAAPSRPVDPYQAFCEQLSDRLEDQLLLLESRPAASGGPSTLLMVVEEDGKKVQSQASRLLDESFADAEQKPHLELLDRNAYEAIQRLIQAGVLQMPGAEGRPLHRSPRMEDDSEKREAEKRLRQARQILSQAERKMKMAQVLSQGGFPIEALPALNEAVEAALHSLACLENLSNGKEPVPVERIESNFESAGHLPEGSSNLVSRLREAVEGQQDDESDAQSLVEEAQRLWESAHSAVGEE